MASKAKVLYSFEGEQANNELTIYEGEILSVLNPNVGDGWWEGSNSRGQKGLFPASYVEPVSQNAAPSAPTRTQSQYSAGSSIDNGNDSWDEDWDDDDPNTGYNHDTNNQHNGEVRRRNTVSRNATIKKSLNRFSVFVKSGGESFLLGATTAENKSILANDLTRIVDTNEGPCWDPIRDSLTCIVREPEKKSKFKGMKSFIAYNVTPSSTNIAVSRRFKHFDWLYCRLLEKFTCLSIPPIPEKQITGKYAENFVEKRRERLERWLNRLSRHPVVHKSEVFQHFLTCSENEKEWKAGKRKAENDKLSGAAFFLTVKCPNTSSININEADEKIEEFGTFFKTMDENVQRLNERCRSYAFKFEGVFSSSHIKFGSSLLSLSSSFQQDVQKQSPLLTRAIEHTGETYNRIGQLFFDQPREDLQHLMEGLHEYSGILSTFPEILHVHKSTVEKVKDCERKQTEEKVEPDLVEQVTSRANTITDVSFAEINLFHDQRVDDFKGMMQSFLQQQIQFYQGVVNQLQDSLNMYDNV